MTLFSKILVVIQFALSVMVMAAAMIFYLTRVDLMADGKDPSIPKGELRLRKDRIADLWDAIRPAEMSWRDSRTDVLAQEGYRTADRPWYEAELKHTRTDANAANPVREPVFKNGVLAVVPVNANPRHVRPEMVAAKDPLGQPLESLTVNFQKQMQKFEARNQAQKDLLVLIEKDRELTELLVPAVGKGLRQRIEDEKVKIKLADEELAIIRPLLVNTTVDSELILRRRQMLEARIKELTAFVVGVASKP